MFEQYKDGLCPGCQQQVNTDFTFHSEEKLVWKTFEITCDTCNYWSKGDNDEFYLLQRTGRNTAQLEICNPSGQVIRYESCIRCPANLSPQYKLPDGSGWVHQFVDPETLDKLVRPYPIS